MLVEFLLWTCLQGKWKTLFHLPHAITSKKTVTWDNTTNCLQKACLLRFVKARGKKLLQQDWIFDASFHCYSTQAFSCLLPLFEKFRCFSGRKQCKEGKQMTRLCYFWGYFQTGYLRCRRKTLTASTIAIRRVFKEKSGFEKQRNFSWGSVKTNLSSFELRQNLGKLCWYWTGIIARGCTNVTKFLIIFVAFK